MNAEVINQFLTATREVLTNFFNISVTLEGAPVAIKGATKMDPITVLLGISGDLEGQFLLGYKSDTALGVARAMMMNPDYPGFDDLCKSALAELGNMVAGTTSTYLAGMGLMCSISPPSVLTSDTGTISFDPSAVLICLPLNTSAGGLRVCIGLRAGNST